MPPTLPIEVAEHAIDFLHNDIHTLAACALASRVLLPTARLHMFYILHVPVQTHPTHPRMQALLEILESNAAIAPLVQFLALRGVPMPHARYQIRERWDDPAGTLRLWERFPNLRILAFTFFKFNMGLHQLLPLAYSLPHLEEIIVLGARAILPGEFSARPPYRDSLIAFTPPPKLKRLSIVGGNISWPFLEDLAKLLLEPSMRAPLDTLNLDCIRNSSNFEYATLDYTETLPSQSWAPVIASLAPTLRDCKLGILATECYRTPSFPSHAMCTVLPRFHARFTSHEHCQPLRQPHAMHPPPVTQRQVQRRDKSSAGQRLLPLHIPRHARGSTLLGPALAVPRARGSRDRVGARTGAHSTWLPGRV